MMNIPELPDEELMILIQQQDENSFSELRLRYQAKLLHHIVSIVHSHDTAQDLLQDVFLRVWTRAELWKETGTVRSWLYAICTNMALNSLRSTSRKREIPLYAGWEQECAADNWTVDAIATDMEAAWEEAEQKATLRDLLDRLPEQKRELMHLVIEADMALKEAAEQMGIPEGTAKSRYHHSTQFMAREWRKRNNE